MKILFATFLFLAYSCIETNKIDVTVSGQKTPENVHVKNKDYCYYFEGIELNTLTFFDSTFQYKNGEMETEERGEYIFDSKTGKGILYRESIIYPSGESEIDNTQFIFELNGDTLMYKSRIEIRDGIVDTMTLDPYPMLRKK